MMSNPHAPSQVVESYRFADVATLWAREKLEHEIIIGRTLARAVICDGLQLQSLDGRWAANREEPLAFRGYPYVGYTARPDSPTCIVRASALYHLFAIVEQGMEPETDKLREEFIFRDDFRDWLLSQGLPLPGFWFPCPEPLA